MMALYSVKKWRKTMRMDIFAVSDPCLWQNRPLQSDLKAAGFVSAVEISAHERSSPLILSPFGAWEAGQPISLRMSAGRLLISRAVRARWRSTL